MNVIGQQNTVSNVLRGKGMAMYLFCGIPFHLNNRILKKIYCL